jgi:hypothetical protein
MADTVKEISAQEKDVSRPTSPSDEGLAVETDPTEAYYMHGAKLNVLVAGLAMAIFIMALDMSILATAIPYITEKFQSTADIGWYLSGYLVTL